MFNSSIAKMEDKGDHTWLSQEADLELQGQDGVVCKQWSSI